MPVTDTECSNCGEALDVRDFYSQECSNCREALPDEVYAGVDASLVPHDVTSPLAKHVEDVIEERDPPDWELKNVEAIAFGARESGMSIWTDERYIDEVDTGHIVAEILGLDGVTRMGLLRQLSPVFAQLHEELMDVNVPLDRYDIDAHVRKEPDCRCGVCSDEVRFRWTSIVDPDEFEYDDWDTEYLHDRHDEEDYERLCIDCGEAFLKNGGEFPDGL